MINKYPQITLVYDRRKKASSTKKSSVEIRITYDGKQKYISTGVMLFPYQWKNGKIINCQDALQISQALDKLLTNVRQVILEMIEEDNIDIFAIQKIIERKKERKNLQLSFTLFCRQRSEIRKYGRTADSQARYDRFIRYFEEWGVIKEFKDINDKNIITFDEYLHSRNLKNSSIWNNYHRFLNSFIIDAIEEGYIQKNPYKWINIEKRRIDSIERCLTLDEFNKIKNTKVPTESLSKVRDVFVFQTYTCLSYSDLKEFDIKNIHNIKDTKVYIGNRNKTSQPFTIPIVSEAWKILQKYNGKLPIISNVKYNEYLKIVAQSAGIDKPISSHWARHTGATLFLNKGIPMEIISKICGHSSIKITEQVYAKMLDETVVDAVSKVKI